ncbi:MAG: adenosylcobinamide-GDP ribazoletransferase [Ghiorsea sp.]|nr:adenosylcobinamide-GDP ribazoletransferase [Ghiorsea sp.]
MKLEPPKLWYHYLATLRFLTIFPTPQVDICITPKLVMFPWVGLTIGFKLYIVFLIFSGFSPFTTAFVLLLVWLISTGFMHLDGVADLADGLGAAHRDPERLLAVMKEPNIGAFGVIALIVLILGKLTLLTSLAFAEVWIVLLLIPAWARLGAAWWANSLTPLSDGLAAWCKQGDDTNLVPWLLFLLFLSAIFSPILLLAPLMLWAWKAFLESKVGGMNGDCLGAGIEACEVALLLLCCLGK